MNCKYCQNEKCIMKGIPNEFHRKCPDAIATNADRIRAMSDEELDGFIEELSPHNKWSIFLDGKRWLNWLKQEVNDVNFD